MATGTGLLLASEGTGVVDCEKAPAVSEESGAARFLPSDLSKVHGQVSATQGWPQAWGIAG